MTPQEVQALLTAMSTFSLLNVGIVQIIKGLKIKGFLIPFISVGTAILIVYLFTKSIDGPGLAMGVIVGLLSCGGYSAFAKVRDAILVARGLKAPPEDPETISGDKLFKTPVV